MSDREQLRESARPSTGLRFSPSRALTETLAAQRDRWILWLPVGMIGGAAAWMSWPNDPPFWLGPAAFVGALAGASFFAFWPSRRADDLGVLFRRVLAGAFALIASIALGAIAADIRTRVLAEPAFAGSDTPMQVQGWVVDLDPGDNGPRLVLLVHDIEGLARAPRYVRIAVPDHALLQPGRAVSCRAVLKPPAGPLAPGGYDFARHAYFERLGASGFSFGRCRPILLPAPADRLDALRLKLAAMRYDLSAAIQAVTPGRGGALAAAMVAGDRSAVDQSTNTTLQNSGLGHLLSVSGVHMGVVGGLVFAALLWTLSLISPLALRVPVKKIAAIGALLALAFYVVISGWSVPALRSLIMAGVAFGAILVDRPAISMRGLALATFISVALFPDSVLDPSFQMSFAATMALVALFEMMRRAPHEVALPTPGPLIGALQTIGRGASAAILVSLVAGLATDPFALYHFQRFSLYSLAANLVVEPIMALVVAPAAAIAGVLAPFGLADWPLKVTASALDLVAAIGDAFGSRPEAVRALPRPPDLSFILVVASLLWACLWRGGLRWLALAPIPFAIALYITAPQPVLAFDGDLRAVFARSSEAANAHWLYMHGHGRSTYAAEKLGAMLGVTPARVAELPPPQACDDNVCAWTDANGRPLFYVLTPAGFARACQPNALVLAHAVAPSTFAQTCHLALLIDQASVNRFGGGLIYETPRGVRVERAAPNGVRRPWTPAVSDGNQE